MRSVNVVAVFDKFDYNRHVRGYVRVRADTRICARSVNVPLAYKWRDHVVSFFLDHGCPCRLRTSPYLSLTVHVYVFPSVQHLTEAPPLKATIKVECTARQPQVT